jgi:hypothetical protein
MHAVAHQEGTHDSSPAAGLTSIERAVYKAQGDTEPVECLALAFEAALVDAGGLWERHVHDLEEYVGWEVRKCWRRAGAREGWWWRVCARGTVGVGVSVYRRREGSMVVGGDGSVGRWGRQHGDWWFFVDDDHGGSK